MSVDLKSEQALNDYQQKLKMGLIKQLNPMEKARQNPKSRRFAINAFCYDCCCEQKYEVRLCPAKKCPLHHLRPWQPKET